MFCSHCGKEISDKAAVCIHCGKDVRRPITEDSAGCGWWWLGFLVPLAGLLIWATCNDTQPKRAKKAGIGALVSTILGVGLTILFFILYFIFIIMLAQGVFF